jgi:two-component system, OmpR family, phosphate regulon response regulator PhoB
MKPLIVICSQDAEFYLLLGHILEVDGFASAPAGSIDDVLGLVAKRPVRAIVLDCRPDNDLAAGSGRLKRDARSGSLPCVALISPGAEGQHITLLQSGVDERFIRPFAPQKLLEYLRTRLAIGLPSGQLAQKRRPLTYRDVEMELDTHRVRSAGGEIPLGPIEFKLLRHMLENPEKVVSRDEFIAAVWPQSASVSAHVVDVHISQLRKLLKQSSRRVAIRTVRLAGYSLEETAG